MGYRWLIFQLGHEQQNRGRQRLGDLRSGLTKQPPEDLPTKFLGKADRIGNFVFEEFSNESDREPLSLAQIRTLEPCA